MPPRCAGVDCKGADMDRGAMALVQVLTAGVEVLTHSGLREPLSTGCVVKGIDLVC